MDSSPQQACKFCCLNTFCEVCTGSLSVSKYPLIFQEDWNQNPTDPGDFPTKQQQQQLNILWKRLQILHLWSQTKPTSTLVQDQMIFNISFNLLVLVMLKKKTCLKKIIYHPCLCRFVQYPGSMLVRLGICSSLIFFKKLEISAFAPLFLFQSWYQDPGVSMVSSPVPS